MNIIDRSAFQNEEFTQENIILENGDLKIKLKFYGHRNYGLSGTIKKEDLHTKCTVINLMKDHLRKYIIQNYDIRVETITIE